MVLCTPSDLHATLRVLDTHLQPRLRAEHADRIQALAVLIDTAHRPIVIVRVWHTLCAWQQQRQYTGRNDGGIGRATAAYVARSCC